MISENQNISENLNITLKDKNGNIKIQQSIVDSKSQLNEIMEKLIKKCKKI